MSPHWQLVLVYVCGLATGAQAALYLYDRIDDGVADWRSAAIAGGMFLASLAVMARLARPRSP